MLKSVLADREGMEEKLFRHHSCEDYFPSLQHVIGLSKAQRKSPFCSLTTSSADTSSTRTTREKIVPFASKTNWFTKEDRVSNPKETDGAQAVCHRPTQLPLNPLLAAHWCSVFFLFSDVSFSAYTRCLRSCSCPYPWPSAACSAGSLPRQTKAAR